MNPNFFLDVLKDNPSQLPIRAESIILEQNIEKAVVATQHLDLDEYVRLEHCSREKVTAPRPLTSVYWGGEDHDTLYENHDEIVWKINWNDHVLEVVHLEWEGGCGSQMREWVIADSEEIAREFISTSSEKPTTLAKQFWSLRTGIGNAAAACTVPPKKPSLTI